MLLDTRAFHCQPPTAESTVVLQHCSETRMPKGASPVTKHELPESGIQDKWLYFGGSFRHTQPGSCRMRNFLTVHGATGGCPFDPPLPKGPSTSGSDVATAEGATTSLCG